MSGDDCTSGHNAITVPETNGLTGYLFWAICNPTPSSTASLFLGYVDSSGVAVSTSPALSYIDTNGFSTGVVT